MPNGLVRKKKNDVHPLLPLDQHNPTLLTFPFITHFQEYIEDARVEISPQDKPHHENGSQVKFRELGANRFAILLVDCRCVGYRINRRSYRLIPLATVNLRWPINAAA